MGIDVTLHRQVIPSKLGTCTCTLDVKILQLLHSISWLYMQLKPIHIRVCHFSCAILKARWNLGTRLQQCTLNMRAVWKLVWSPSASTPGSLSRRKESLVHNVCACVEPSRNPGGLDITENCFRLQNVILVLIQRIHRLPHSPTSVYNLVFYSCLGQATKSKLPKRKGLELVFSHSVGQSAFRDVYAFLTFNKSFVVLRKMMGEPFCQVFCIEPAFVLIHMV